MRRPGKPRSEPPPGVTRREILAALARWTVPTVLTLSLGTRVARAAISCPPCTKNVAGKCKACTLNQQLNCQCEPCLGAPYCSPSASATRGLFQSPTPFSSGTGEGPRLGGAQRGPVPGGGSQGTLEGPLVPGWRTRRRPGTGFTSPFAQPGDSLFGSPLGDAVERRSGQGVRSPFSGGGLYERLQEDARRRRP